MNDRLKFRAWHKEYKRMVDVYKFGQDMGVCEWVWHSNIYPTKILREQMYQIMLALED